MWFFPLIRKLVTDKHKQTQNKSLGVIFEKLTTNTLFYKDLLIGQLVYSVTFVWGYRKVIYLWVLIRKGRCKILLQIIVQINIRNPENKVVFSYKN